MYQITNLINGKIYIGVHATNNLEDNYMGSGSYLNRAYDKHGIENFKKEILKFFDSKEDMFLDEAEVVDKKFLETTDTYNLVTGGKGSWKSTTGKFPAKDKDGNTFLADCDDPRRLTGEIVGVTKGKPGVCSFKGKHHSEEFKKKIGKILSESQTGKGNSQYGTMWITNGLESKKIKKGVMIPEGFVRGRKINIAVCQ